MNLPVSLFLPRPNATIAYEYAANRCGLIILATILFLSAGMADTRASEPKVSSPAEYLGYELGDRFTRHHDLVAYFEHVADKSPKVALRQYGESYQRRPLFAVFVSSEENIRERDTIRVNNRRMTGLEPGEVSGRTAAISWLSYGLHGNESSSPEAAMLTLYELVSGEPTSAGNTPEEVAGWLENTLVIIDPVLNPDGRHRYVSWFEQTTGRRPDPRLEVREHNEPWPGGRSNHYYFDLNRDWSWQIQQETRQRIAFYNTWMPHVHADFHEMFTSDYFFPPSAEPFHMAITDWQREFQYKIGRNHADYFDQRRERYFTREIFDLFYPGFGDTWPTFSGAIGMTYEQMGHGRAGTKMIRENGDTLTLSQRLMNHHVVGLSTVEVTSQNQERLQEEFRTFFQKGATDPQGEHDSFVLAGDNQPDRLKALLNFLDRQEIRYEEAEAGRRMTGWNYRTGQEESRRTMEGDVVIPLSQPKSTLTRVMFEPDPELPDTSTYDITAWALPFAYGLQAWAVDGRVRSTGETVRLESQFRALSGNGSERLDEVYGYVVGWGDVNDAAFLADLLQEEIRVQVAERPLTVEGESFEAGALLVVNGANRRFSEKKLQERIDYYAARHDRKVTPVTTGFSESGTDFGSPRFHLVHKPAVAVPSGSGVSSYNLGEMRHFFDYKLDYPLAVFDVDRLSAFPLDDYDVLLLPGGRYLSGDAFDWEKVMSWVAGGGRLIAFPDAVRALSELEEVDIDLRTFEDEAENDDQTALDEQAVAREQREQARFEERRRKLLPRQISGAVYQVKMDDSHPLAFGLGEVYASIKRGSMAVDPLESGWNVGLYEEKNSILGGWAGHEAQKLQNGALAFGTVSHGQGGLVLLSDNPLFRGFWRNGELLFSNALFQVPIAF